MGCRPSCRIGAGDGGQRPDLHVLSGGFGRLFPAPRFAISTFGIIFDRTIIGNTESRRPASRPRHGDRQQRLGDGMQESIARLDDALIDRVCQPVADRLAAALSVDCFRLARSCNDAAALAWILSQAGRVSDAFATGNMALAGAQGGLIIVGLAALTTLRRVFDGKQGSRSSSGARANPLRPAMFLHRLGCLLWLGAQLLRTTTGPSGFAETLIVVMGLMTTASVYVGACSSPPPERHGRPNRNWLWRPAAIRHS